MRSSNIVTMVSEPCLCCGVAAWRHYCYAGGYQFLQCRACQFVRLDLPSQFDTTSLYNEDYFFGRGFDESRLIPESRHPLPALVARRRYWLRVLAEAIGGPGRLLDVGTGAGALLDVARDMGWRAVGQEVSEVGAAEARSRGHQVQVGQLADCDFQAGSFDAATIIEVIEHLADPRPTIAAVLKTLRPEGWLLISTGDVGSLRARIRGGRWGYLRPPGHVSYFTHRSLAQLLTSAGFRHVKPVSTYNLAFPSIPGLKPSRSRIIRSAAYNLRRLSRMELCCIAQA
jgi:SAM-dependent methyltransferase